MTEASIRTSAVLSLRTRDLAYGCLLGLLCWALFAPLTRSPFADGDLLPRFLAGSAEYPAELRESPALILLLELVGAASGGAATAYRATGVALHLAAALLLASVALRLGLSRSIAYLSGVLFLVNVAHLNAIHWIPGFRHPLALVFCLTAVLFFERYHDSRRRGDLALFGVGVFASGLAHLVGVTVLLLCWCRARRDGRHCGLAWTAGLAGAVLAAAVAVAVGATDAPDGSSVWSPQWDLGQAADSLLWVWGRMVTTAHWLPFPLYARMAWQVTAGAAALLAVLILAFRGPATVSGWAAWTLLASLPFAFLSPDHLYAVRAGVSQHLYVASAGASVLLAWILDSLFAFPVRRLRWLGLGLAGAVLLWVLLSSARASREAGAFTLYGLAIDLFNAGEYGRSASLMRRAIDEGGTAIPQQNAYSVLFHASMPHGSACEQVLAEAAAACPESEEFMIYGLVCGSLDPDPRISAAAVRELYSIGPYMPPAVANVAARAYNNLGGAYVRLGEQESAVTAFRHALDLAQHNPARARQLATVLANSGNRAGAMRLLEDVVAAGKDNPDVRQLLGAYSAGEGLYDQAITHWRQGLSMDPGASALHYNLALVYGTNLQKYQESVRHWLRVIELGGGDVQAYVQLGNAYSHLGMSREAMNTFQRVLDLYPDTPEAEQVRQAMSR